ncbi:hypothetical protein CW714_07955 [Methanophagales archaeon]|nr:MAG: hypothetical protein CW714_07955 [Methanophagales archaeon]
MRKVKIESVEDLEALPEDEWVEVPEGLHAKFVYSIDRENNKLTIVLPEEIAKRIGNRLFASFDEGKIVISEIKE